MPRAAPLVLLLLLPAEEARAAGCCGTGPSAIERLGSAEAASLSLTTSGQRTLGGWNSEGSWGDAAQGDEARLELAGAVAVGARVQLGFALPAQYAWREAGALAGEGGGLGDLTFTGWIDPLPAGLPSSTPSVGLTLALRTPTGRSDADARAPLAADATGLGGFELRPGLSIEGELGPLTLAGSGSVGLREETSAYGLTVQRAPGFALYGFVGRWFGPWLVGGAASTSWEGAPSIEGRAVDAAARRRTGGALLAAWELDRSWSLGAEARAELPVGGAGRNEPGGVGARLTLRRAILGAGGAG